VALGLVTDLYQLTMAAGYFEAGKTQDRATFELSVRRLPYNRNFILPRLARQSNICSTSAFAGGNCVPRGSRIRYASAYFSRCWFALHRRPFAVPEGTPVCR
jgi:nicotinate phosphoribosyltransferase